ncbi:uncharacterized protein KQ657_004211 [Scheffersomyces spartinae]|uniref:Uncharacterized protein n=1 Tax=Scheffersomyces spartinae TaxID=45513 RepID=A0A9P7VC59_9ASCO|nr:uncharacterized protein KQ657_004211 [Scheffersomyces spartinae]KAG7195095.1 hypothetical protein KQ657_004211 [Scheffersomyces spartinae]
MLEARTLLYWLVLTVVVPYTVTLIVANLVPGVRVGSIGWFTVRGVEIAKTNKKIKIGKLKLRVSTFFGRSKDLKSLKILIEDLSIELSPRESTKATEIVPPVASSPPTAKLNSSVSLPKWVFESSLIRGIACYIQFEVVNCTLIQLQNNSSTAIDAYVEKMHASFNIASYSEGTVLLAFRGAVLKHLYQPLKECPKINGGSLVFRFFLSYSCQMKNPNVMDLSIDQIEIKSSLSNAIISLDEILPSLKKAKELKTITKSKTKVENSLAAGTDLTGLKPLITSISGKIKSFGFRLEDFQLKYKSIVALFGNIQTLVEGDDFGTIIDKTKVTLFGTAFRVKHLEYTCVELPSVTFQVASSFSDLVDLALSPKNCKDLCISTRLSLTTPQLNIYYDQIELLVNERIASFASISSSSKKDKKPSKSKTMVLEFLRQFQRVTFKLNILEFEISVHLPRTKDATNYSRTNPQNLIVKHRALTIYHKFSSSNLNKDIEKAIAEKRTLNYLFRAKRWRTDIEGNTINVSKLNLIVHYDVVKNSLYIKTVAKTMLVNSINNLIFFLIHESRNRKVRIQNRKYEHLRRLGLKSSTSEETLGIKDCHNNDVSNDNLNISDQVEHLKLFEILPSFVSRIGIQVSSISFDISFKDNLPSYLMNDDLLGVEVDMGDFRRGSSYKLNDLSLTYNKKRSIFDFSIGSFNNYTLSDFATEYVADFDQIEKRNDHRDYSDVSTLDSAFSTEYEENAEEGVLMSNKIKRVLVIQDISFRNSHEDPDKLVGRIPEIDGRVDMFLCWCVLYAKSMIEYFAPTEKSVCSKEKLQRMSGKRPKKLNLSVSVDSTAIVVRLPHKVDVMIELDDLRMEDILLSSTLNLKFCRLYVIHPATKLWTRLLVISEPSFHFGKAQNESITYPKFEIIANYIKLSIPYQFALYTVIDNFITFFKAQRQVLHNFHELKIKGNDFSKLLPTEKPPVLMPQLNIKSKILGLKIENDPFENELSYIFELGLVEQRERIQKYKYLEERIEAINSKTMPTIDELAELTYSDEKQDQSNIFGRLASPKPSASEKCQIRRLFLSHTTVPNWKNKTSSTTTKTSNGAHLEEAPVLLDEENYYTKEEADSLIDKVTDQLNRELSSSWVLKYKKFRQEAINRWNFRTEQNWGSDDINHIIKNKFDILDYAEGPPLFGAGTRNLDLTIDRAKVDVEKFLETHQKQPKLIYSILVPLYVKLRSSDFYVFLKDYHLPVVAFPAHLNPNIKAVNVEGTIIVNERLVSRKEEMRYIYVPFSPAAKVPSSVFEDSFYSCFIPRTLMPVKMAYDLKWKLDTDKSCLIAWNKSYLPALLASMTALDNFTKPPIDDSPLGWWDKLPLIMHGKVVVDVANELCLHIKSSTSPYDLVGKSTGFVFSWRSNVKLGINTTGKSEELITLESDDFLLAVPNYSNQERKAWSFFFEDDEQPMDIEAEARKFAKRVITLTSAERVVWKLGFTFERNKDKSDMLCDNQERTSQFRPHYDVTVTNPLFEYHPDSYEGYRSDYLHLAFTVISRSQTGNSHNSVYFSPLVFEYFFNWWDTMTKWTSLPVKKGKLFSDIPTMKHVKLGTHLFTVKYQIIFEPLTVSHMYMHSDPKNNTIAFTGLKGKSSKCVIDLHQRKELLTYVNEKLNIHSKSMHLKMNQGECEVDNADIRIVKATFSDRSLESKMVSYFINESDTPLSHNNSEPNSRVFNNSHDWLNYYSASEFSWIDPDDFIELEMNEVLSPYPKIKVLPFLNVPKFSYFRDFSLQEDGLYPFGNEASHECAMGVDAPEVVQHDIWSERLKEIKSNVDRIENLLHRMTTIENAPYIANHELHNENVSALKVELNIEKEKYDVANYVMEYFEKKDEVVDSDGTGGGCQLSRVGSSASSKKSIVLLKDLASLNTSGREFHNRFVIHNLRLKLDNKVRDEFMLYLKLQKEKKTRGCILTWKAAELVSKVLSEHDERLGFISIEEEEEKGNANTLLFNNSINGDLDTQVYSHDNELQEIERKYQVKLVHPQFQLISDKSPDSCILVTATDLEYNGVSVNAKGTRTIIGSDFSGLVENRSIVRFSNSHIFGFERKDEQLEASNPFTGTKTWPPWLDAEVCYDSSWQKNELLAERNTLVILTKDPNDFSTDMSNLQKQMLVDLSKIVLNVTTEQYTALYYITLDLLLSSEDKKDKMSKKLEKLVSMSDISDFEGLDSRVHKLQRSIREYKLLLLKLIQRITLPTNEDTLTLLRLEMEIERRTLELSLILRGLRTRFTSRNKRQQIVNVHADQVVWHLLDSQREPTIDFALANSQYTVLEDTDGSKTSEVFIEMVQGFNLEKNALFPEMLSPFLCDSCDKRKPIIYSKWRELEAIGGIPIIANCNMEIQPLKIQIDYVTAKKLFAYLFPHAETNGNETNGDNEDDFVDLFDQDSGSGESLSIHSSSTTDSTKRSSSSKNPLRKFINKRLSNSTGSHSSSSTLVGSSTPTAGLTDSLTLGRGSTGEAKSGFKRGGKKTIDMEDDVSTILARSARFTSIHKLELASTVIHMSFSAPKLLSILDVHGLSLKIPVLSYKNKLWAGEDFVVQLRKDIIKILLSHTGRILGNKFKRKKKPSKHTSSSPLNQIKNYDSFMTVDDLQKEGRSRDTSKNDNFATDAHRLSLKLQKPRPHQPAVHSLKTVEAFMDNVCEGEESKQEE